MNSPEIFSEEFNKYGTSYSVRLIGSLNRFVRIAGQGTIMGQEYGVIPDKALMVFAIWADNKVGNEDGGGEEREAGEGAYYEPYGNWSTLTDETAHRSSVDVVSSTDLAASALFKMDIGRSGRYDILVSYPEAENGSSNAKYEVYFIEHSFDETGDTETIVTEPVLTALVDQSSREAEAMDDEGFISIGEVDVTLGAGVDLVTVVVRLSSGGEETRQAVPTYVMADAVKFEQVGF